MSVKELLCDLRIKGFQLTPLPGDRLEVKPGSKLTDELRQEIRAHKAEVLYLLTYPHLTDTGELRIPFSCPEKYHWWRGGQSIAATLLELGADANTMRRYCGMYTETKQ